MTHMDAAGWIGKHFQQVVFGFCSIFRYFKRAVGCPGILPFFINDLGIISFFHVTTPVLKTIIYLFENWQQYAQPDRLRPGTPVTTA
jgi:hypothetical protein